MMPKNPCRGANDCELWLALVTIGQFAALQRAFVLRRHAVGARRYRLSQGGGPGLGFENRRIAFGSLCGTGNGWSRHGRSGGDQARAQKIAATGIDRANVVTAQETFRRASQMTWRSIMDDIDSLLVKSSIAASSSAREDCHAPQNSARVHPCSRRLSAS